VGAASCRDDRGWKPLPQLRHFLDILAQTDGVVDVDWYMEEDQLRYQITVDRKNAALNGISVAQVAESLKLTVSGRQSGLLHLPQQKEDVTILLRPPLEQRAGIERLQAVRIPGNGGGMVTLADLVRVEKTEIDRSIYHKNLMPVVYVIGEVAGEIELRLQQGMPLDQAVVDAGAVRFRPMMLTAAAVVVGASVILFDPIFQGLAIALMAGEVASLLFSRMTVPILYFQDKRWESASKNG
jgi:multidrug efflux pump subunit AcrB